MFRNSSYEEDQSETDSQPTSTQQQMSESDNDSDNDMQVFAQFVQEAYENIPEDRLAVLLNKKRDKLVKEIRKELCRVIFRYVQIQEQWQEDNELIAIQSLMDKYTDKEENEKDEDSFMAVKYASNKRKEQFTKQIENFLNLQAIKEEEEAKIGGF